MRCDPVRVTGYVDGELPSYLAARIARHLSLCRRCTAQAAFEMELCMRLRFLNEAVPPPGVVLRSCRSGPPSTPRNQCRGPGI